MSVKQNSKEKKIMICKLIYTEFKIQEIFPSRLANLINKLMLCTHLFIGFRVLTRILKIGVKCCPPEKVGVLPYLSIETFQKVGVRNEKLE